MPDPTADVLLHPVRMRIIVAVFDRQLTTRQIASAIPDVPQATLYRHINKLAAAGVLRVVDQRQARGATEKVYATVREATSLGSRASEMTPDEWSHAFSAFTAFLTGQFTAYIHSPDARPIPDGVHFRTVPLHLSDEEFATLIANLGALIRPLLENAPSPDRRRRQISTVVIPDPRNTSEKESQ